VLFNTKAHKTFSHSSLEIYVEISEFGTEDIV